MINKSILLGAAFLAAGFFTNVSVQAAASDNGVGGVMPAFYDDELFKINLKELSDEAADAALAHNASINVIYECDSCPGFIAVLDAIQGDGFNPLWLEVQIEFTAGHAPHQFGSDDEIEDAEAAGEITLSDTGELYRCSVIGKP
jgi:hypothetical protein